MSLLNFEWVPEWSMWRLGEQMTALIGFRPGTCFGPQGHAGLHFMHDTVAKDYRHAGELNFQAINPHAGQPT